MYFGSDNVAFDKGEWDGREIVALSKLYRKRKKKGELKRKREGKILI